MNQKEYKNIYLLDGAVVLADNEREAETMLLDCVWHQDSRNNPRADRKQVSKKVIQINPTLGGIIIA